MKYLMLIISAVFTIWMLCYSVLEAKAFLVDHSPWHFGLFLVFGVMSYWNAKSFISRAPTLPKTK